MAFENRIDEILRIHQSWRKARRRGDSKRREELADRFEILARELMGTAEGRAALEELQQNPSPQLRYSASSAVIEWAPEKAIPVLARLLYEPFDEDMEPWEEVSVRTQACMPLAEYFGYHPSNWSELPERLAEYGIDLPKETVRMLHWGRHG
jgi:hypothetical protein